MPKQVEKEGAVAVVKTEDAKPAEKPAKKVAKKATKKTTTKKTTKKAVSEKTAVASERPTKKPLVRESGSAKETIEAKVNMFFETNKDNKQLKKILSVAKLMEASAHVGLPANL
ncbi:MAG: hypothetical protein MJ223_03960 [Mycoplasmoidaceae bacterium]|nr:hypothetical protein [Mycoplasmoidaceae bacterium]